MIPVRERPTTARLGLVQTGFRIPPGDEQRAAFEAYAFSRESVSVRPAVAGAAYSLAARASARSDQSRILGLWKAGVTPHELVEPPFNFRVGDVRAVLAQYRQGGA